MVTDLCSKQMSDLMFDPLTVGTVTYTAAQQQAAFDTYINNNKYLFQKEKRRHAKEMAALTHG